MSTAIEFHSTDLLWEIVRNNNAFLVKRRGYGGVQFSRDPYNLTNLHSRKHEGFVNEKAIGFKADSSNTVGYSTKTKHHHKPSKSSHNTSFAANTGSRKIYRSVVNSTAKKGYRSDLRAQAVARASALKLSQREKKETAAPKARGKKARNAAQKSEA